MRQPMRHPPGQCPGQPRGRPVIGRGLRVAIMLLALFLPALGATRAGAVNPDEMLDDPALEARARALSKGLRCLVCRNQNIDDSHAQLARDFRILLRERLAAGDSDEEAVNFLVRRYGSYILLEPPVNATTIMLWVGPALLLLAATAGFWLVLRRGRGAGDTASGEPPEDAQLSDEDRALISRILGEEVSQ